MAPLVGDILQITDQQTFLGNTLLNVFFYEIGSIGVDTDYDDIRVAFETNIIDQMVFLQSTFCEHIRVIIKNLTNELDIHESPVSVLGTLTGQASQSFVAYSFRLVRSTALTRHGSKRVGGLPESSLNGNGVETTVAADLNAFATVLGDPIVEDTTPGREITLNPVIVGRFLITDPNPGELDLSKINPVASAQFIRLTSQATRRAGRGI